jgi:rfaE bifunctional protein nucleotidyltransferase chain/domain
MKVLLERRRVFAIALLACGAAATLPACVPLVATGVGTAALVADDRRTAGIMVEDESIENKILIRAEQKHGANIHLNATSFTRIVLLTGEATSPGIRDDIERIARGVENVRSVTNEITVAQPTTLILRSNDAVLTSKVKARFVEANRFRANHVKVVTENSVVYLMGMVKHSEADEAAKLARTAGGVHREVRVIEYIDLAGARRIGRHMGAATASALPPPAYLRKICGEHDFDRHVGALGRPVVFTNGVFDILHAGHVAYLDQAASLGTSLVVGVNADESVRRLGKGAERPLNGIDDRMAVLAALESVSLVIPFAEDTPVRLIGDVHPDILVKGGDWDMDRLPESAMVRGWGGRVLAIPFIHDRSTTALVRKIRQG